MIVLIAAAAFLATIVLGLASLIVRHDPTVHAERRSALYLRSASAGFFILMVGAISTTVLS